MPSSIDLLAGQRLVVGFNGARLTDALKTFIQEFHIGGVTLFSRNIESPDQVRDLCLAIQDHARSNGLPRLFISIDQEGGVVARLKEPFTVFPGNPHMAGIADAKRFADVTAGELLSAGIDMNFAPVMDTADPEGGSAVENRVFPGGPEEVARMGAAVIRGLQERGVMAVAKHFPGIGRTRIDSHVDLPVMEAPVDALEEIELIPFKAAVAAGVSGIMLSHILYPALDPDFPASISRKIAHDLLRVKMGYDGLVLTDDLDMGAVEKHFSLTDALDNALEADVDLMLICHESPKIEQAFGRLRDALSDDSRLREKGEASLKRILKAKAAYPGQAEPPFWRE